MKEVIIKQVEIFVEAEMRGVCSSHDFFHIQHVLRNARRLQKMENKGDLMIIEIGALLHESLDHKFFLKENMSQRKQEIRCFLETLEIAEKNIEQILFIIENVGYGKSLKREKDFVGSVEFQIVEDADRLEGIGAVNIARTFAYGGKIQRVIYEPGIEVDINLTESSYLNTENTSINHFYEKTLKLKDLMHTESAKLLAQSRHDFTKIFLDEFFAEWNGER